jgi:hypothetical protein
VAFGFLQAQDVGLGCTKPIEEAFVVDGPQAINVPGVKCCHAAIVPFLAEWEM